MLSSLALMVVQRQSAASTPASPSSSGQQVLFAFPILRCTSPPSRSTHAFSLRVSTGHVFFFAGGAHPGVRTTGGVPTVGVVTGGRVTGGRVTGGRVTGGSFTGGFVTTGGRVTGGSVTGGFVTTGGRVTGGRVTGGRPMVGVPLPDLLGGLQVPQASANGVEEMKIMSMMRKADILEESIAAQNKRLHLFFFFYLVTYCYWVLLLYRGKEEEQILMVYQRTMREW